jgi:hypothetical protein
VIVGVSKGMDELQKLIEKIQQYTGSSVVDLRYRPEEYGSGAHVNSGQPYR